MTYVTTDPEALLAAATNLEGIGSGLATQNSAAAGPTTGILPAAADEVSALQATQFDAYGALYQQISAQATAIQELFVHTLRTSADSYGATEAANTAAAAPSVAAGGLSAVSGTTQASDFGLAGTLSNSAILATMNGANFGSATSEFTSLGKGFITNPPGVVAAGTLTSQQTLASEATAAASASPASNAAVAPVSVGVGQAATVSGLSAPPSWAGEAAPVAEPTPAQPAGPGWTAAPHSAPASTVSTGMPAVASADRSGHGYGKPRYGVKPTVMPAPEVV